MLSAQWGIVTRIIGQRPGALEVWVECADSPEDSGVALAYLPITGPVEPGDRVLINTTAVRLGLGTGGLHFILAVDRPTQSVAEDSAPHVVKLRYTPVQHTVAVVEGGPLRERLQQAPGLGGMPVVAAELHSQVAPIAAGVRALAPRATIAYIMPDSAALALPLSRLVPRLKEVGLVNVTLTCGQAFGGDYETVSLPSALQAARELGADVTIVAQGPGNAGTGTRLGFSGIAQADWLNAAHALGGTPIACLRLSFADPRPRHQGISHHTLTILGTFCLCQAVVPIPFLPASQREPVNQQLTPLREKHHLEEHDGAPALALLEQLGVTVTTMGRSMAEDRAFFLAAGAAGVAAAQYALRRAPNSSAGKPPRFQGADAEEEV